MIFKWFIIPGILFLVTAALIAASSTGRVCHAANTMVLDESWNGKKIELKVGDEIQIELQGTGATGYAWYIDRLDTNLFQLLSEDRGEKGSSRGESVGSPTRYIWAIKSKTPGKSIIMMSYYRIWEGKDQAIRRFEIEVNVSP